MDCAESVQFVLVYGETALDGLEELRLICGATFCSQCGCQDCHVGQLYRYVDDVVGTGDARTAGTTANSRVGVRIFDLGNQTTETQDFILSVPETFGRHVPDEKTSAYPPRLQMSITSIINLTEFA